MYSKQHLVEGLYQVVAGTGFMCMYYLKPKRIKEHELKSPETIKNNNIEILWLVLMNYVPTLPKIESKNEKWDQHIKRSIYIFCALSGKYI
ncbi:unnamed protein product [Ilex paraguariensis]|uniref:Uncharacterized protein n=1 Tax=Ilex paraguariensis TaxID=185542 RepID=A0ABC8RYC4_9AQUA